MKIRLTLVTGISLMLIATGLLLALTGREGAGQQVFFTMLGIVGWLAGNKINELEQRLHQIEAARSNARAPERS